MINRKGTKGSKTLGKQGFLFLYWGELEETTTITTTTTTEQQQQQQQQEQQ